MIYVFSLAEPTKSIFRFHLINLYSTLCLRKLWDRFINTIIRIGWNIHLEMLKKGQSPICHGGLLLLFRITLWIYYITNFPYQQNLSTTDTSTYTEITNWRGGDGTVNKCTARRWKVGGSKEIIDLISVLWIKTTWHHNSIYTNT